MGNLCLDLNEKNGVMKHFYNSLKTLTLIIVLSFATNANAQIPLTNPFPGFPLDEDYNGCNNYIDYSLIDMVLTKNGDGTMTISGQIGDAIDALWDGCVATPCGADDGWDVVLTLSDKMDWTTFQANGGTAYLHNNCSGMEADMEFWDIEGILTGTGCNAGRTITVLKPVSPYRIQIGYGGLNTDGTCAFGMSTWLVLEENGVIGGADIYAYLSETLYNQEICGNGIDDNGDGIVDCDSPNAPNNDGHYTADEIMLPALPTCDNASFMWDGQVYLDGPNSSNLQTKSNLEGTDKYSFGTCSNCTRRYTIPGPYPAEFGSTVSIDVSEVITVDASSKRADDNPNLQSFEQIKIIFLLDGELQAETDFTEDLKDNVVAAQWIGDLGSVTLPNGTDEIIIIHYEDNQYGNGQKAGPNSLEISSICFDYTPVDGKDYGDAPASYGDICYAIKTGNETKFGATVDNENASQHSANADGDGADEDGIVFSNNGAWIRGTEQTLTVTWTTNDWEGHIFGWIDWNANGVFDDPLERVITNFKVGSKGYPDNYGGTMAVSGTKTFTVNVPADAACGGTTYARFTNSSDVATAGPTGNFCADPNDDGEVEDYMLIIGCVPEICGNGIDDDSDGLTDCFDNDCGPINPAAITVNPTCPYPYDGQIVLNATGNNLQYSIDNGETWQASNTFNNLTHGNYLAIIRDSISGCSIWVNNSGAKPIISLVDPGCPEICDNGLDDDGDGAIDDNDPNCFTCDTALISNGDFQNNISNWVETGNTTMFLESNSNLYVQLHNGDELQQNVAVNPSSVYKLVFFAKGAQGNQGEVGIVFLNSSLNSIGNEVLQTIDSETFKQYSITAKAPTDAAYVRVFVKNQGVEKISIDDFCLSEVVQSCDSGIDAEDEVCANESILFAVENPIIDATYKWTFGGNASISTSSNPSETVSWSATGIKTVTLEIISENCTSEYTHEIEVTEAVFAAAGNDTTICAQSSVQIGGSPSGPEGAQYLWTPNLFLDDNTIPNPTATPPTDITYTLTVTKNGCTSTSTVTVEVGVNPVPEATVSADAYICDGETAVLTAAGGGTYLWSTGATTPSINVAPTTTTIYTVTVTNEYGCSDMDEVTVFAGQCDFGDAPASYKTADAKHIFANQLYFGNIVDHEMAATNQISFDAGYDGAGGDDGSDGSDDEDGIASFPRVLTVDTTMVLDVDYTNNTNEIAYIYAWFDFNQNGAFEVKEAASLVVGPESRTISQLVWDLSDLIPGVDIMYGESFARFRIMEEDLTDNASTLQDERSVLTALGGEIEDYMVFISGVDEGDQGGNCPVATIVSANPATRTAYLGMMAPDVEYSSSTNPNATIDVEDDGLIVPYQGYHYPGETYSYQLQLNSNLDNSNVNFGLWFDWDNNGNYDDDIDQFYQGDAMVASAGQPQEVEIVVTIPLGATPDYTIRAMAAVEPITASNVCGRMGVPGEVEDYSRINRNTVLPVEFLQFDATALENNTVLVEWATATEINNDYYVVEVSTDALNWDSLGYVDGAGNSNVELAYSFIHNQPANGISYYRVKQVDYDGSTDYTEVKSVQFTVSREMSVYPNPSNGVFNIQLKSDKATITRNIQIYIYNAIGNLVHTEEMAGELGSLMKLIDLSHFNIGFYTLQIVEGNKKVGEQKLIIQY